MKETTKLCGRHAYQLSVDEEKYPRKTKTRKGSSFLIYSPLLRAAPAVQACSEASGQSQFWFLPAAIIIISLAFNSSSNSSSRGSNSMSCSSLSPRSRSQSCCAWRWRVRWSSGQRVMSVSQSLRKTLLLKAKGDRTKAE